MTGESLATVLDGWAISWLEQEYDGTRWFCSVEKPGERRPKPRGRGHGSGDTPEAAIRSAVAQAEKYNRKKDT